MNMTSTVERIKSANPVPSPDSLPSGALSSTALLARVDERSRTMADTVTEMRRTDPALPPPRSRGPLVALAVAAVLILIVGVATFGLVRGDDQQVDTEPPVTATTTTQAPTTTLPAVPASEEIARAFIEASNAEDAAAVVSRVAPNAGVSLAGVSGRTDLEAWFEWNRAIGFETTMTGCEVVSGAELTCGYRYDGPWMRALGVAPVSGSTMTLTIEDGTITAVRESIVFEPFQPVWDAFKSWLGRAYPEASDRILRADDTPVLTRQALDEWQQYSAEFEESVNLTALGDQYLDAFLSFDPVQFKAVIGAAVGVDDERYLQLFSAAADYVLAERSCEAAVRSVVCTTKGTDDIAAMLGADYVDTFWIRVTASGTIRTVDWKMQTVPPGVMDDFYGWLQADQPALFESGGVCEGFMNGGPTPGDCALAWLAAAPDYAAAGTP